MTTDHDDDDRDDAPALPDRDVLDAWRVPAPAPELTDRVLAHVEAALPLGAVAVLPVASRRKGLPLVVVGVAMLAAAALVLGLAQSWRRPPAAEPASAAVTAPPPTLDPSVDDAPEPERAPTKADAPAAAEAPYDPVSPELVDVLLVPPVEDAARKGRKGRKASKAKPDDDAKKTATLRIGTARGQSWATVFIDGVRIGATPIMNAKVTPGRHTVRWEWADGTSATTVEIEVAAGETKTVKSPPPSASSATP